ncbi:MAG: TonB-dependent receptor domain-containing protein [Terriglobia bacterium]
MRFRVFGFRSFILGALFLPLCAASSLLAQTPSGVLRGQVTDPSGAAVTGATVSVSSAKARTRTAKTNQVGAYEIKGLPSGTYTVTVVAPSFSVFEQQKVVIAAGRIQRLNVPLHIQQQVQQVTVSAQATHVGVSPENNASALVIQGKALAALSDDPDELQEELSALAGPAAGPNGGQIYIDGFTGGQLPPKSDILAIHVNQNPFSAQYDRVGYGRIEIITKPGASQYHGSVFADGNDSAFNSRNPFVTQEPPYHSEFFNGNIGGPLGHKASFFFDTFRRSINDSSIVNAIVLDPSFAQVRLTQAVLHPQTRMLITPRIDYQISAKNVLTVRYQLWRDSGINDGIGQFALPSQAFNTHGTEHTLQLGDTQILSDRTVNETRFQFRYGTNNQTPQNLQPAVNVLGAFTGGGNTQGKSADTLQSYELHNLTTMSLGKHTLLFGGRLREWNDSSASTANFNGAYSFPTLTAYQIMEQGLQQGLTFAQIRAAGGGPSQFSIAAGNPIAKVSLADLGLYAEDQWRARPNLSLSAGLRFESQNDIHDHADFAPRIGLAWGLGRGKSPGTVLRAGFGIFYDRFEYDHVLQAERLNGVNQQKFLITNPAFFPTAPPTSTLGMLANGATTPAVYDIGPALRAPYTIQSAIGLEQQVSKNITASVTYLNSHGVHQFLTRNINTPLPGQYDPANPAIGRPFADVSACAVASALPNCADGFVGNIFQFESNGLYNQNELISNFRVNEGILTLFGFYTLNYASSDTNGVSSSPSNPYDILQDYGRAAFDVRHRLVVGGALSLPYGFRIMPFMHVNSGSPYDITLGHDLLGTSVFNQRPALAAPGQTGPNIVVTRLGTFNTTPGIGEPVIPVNSGDGPGAFNLNLRLSKTFGFGERKGGGGGGGFGGGGHHHGGLGGRGLSGGGGRNFWRSSENARYNLTFSVTAHNVFNNVNLGTPVGNLGSPLFGLSNSLAGGRFSSQASNRRIDLQVRFSFYQLVMAHCDTRKA